MFILTDKLDRIASTLESKGYLKEAEEIDIIANTLEAMELEAFNVEMSPLYKILSKIFKAIKDNNSRAALGFHQQGLGLKEQLAKSYGQTPEGAAVAAQFAKSYDEIRNLIESGNLNDAVAKIQEALGSFKSLTSAIKKDYSGQQRIQPGQPGPSDQPGAKPAEMIFSPHKGKGAPARTPLAPPARALRE